MGHQRLSLERRGSYSPSMRKYRSVKG